MFGDSKFADDLADLLLKSFSLEEILEMNDLDDKETLKILIQRGYVTEPETYFNEAYERD